MEYVYIYIIINIIYVCRIFLGKIHKNTCTKPLQTHRRGRFHFIRQMKSVGRWSEVLRLPPCPLTMSSNGAMTRSSLHTTWPSTGFTEDIWRHVVCKILDWFWLHTHLTTFKCHKSSSYARAICFVFRNTWNTMKQPLLQGTLHILNAAVPILAMWPMDFDADASNWLRWTLNHLVRDPATRAFCRLKRLAMTVGEVFPWPCDWKPKMGNAIKPPTRVAFAGMLRHADHHK